MRKIKDQSLPGDRRETALKKKVGSWPARLVTLACLSDARRAAGRRTGQSRCRSPDRQKEMI